MNTEYLTKKTVVSFFVLVLFLSGQSFLLANEPDSAYIFVYGAAKNNHHNGLHVAWSLDKQTWHPVGTEHSFVKSDYGPWGAEKKMIDPFLFRAPDGIWHCVWSLNNEDGAFGYASSTDLLTWNRQSYPLVLSTGNCLKPMIAYDDTNDVYTISWTSDKEHNQAYFVTTKDFKHYSPAKKATVFLPRTEKVALPDGQQSGTLHKVAWHTVDNVIKAQQLAAYKTKLNSERMTDDDQRFSTLKDVKATINVNQNTTRQISDLLVGIFFEDINYAADGGLYAELIQNRGFEYSPNIRKEWDNLTAWNVYDAHSKLSIDTVSPIHINNKHYVTVEASAGGGLYNEGFGGIAVRANEKYNLSLFARAPEANIANLLIRLEDANGKTIGQATIKRLTKAWKKHELTVIPTVTAENAKLVIQLQEAGKVNLDMVSLFPQNTFRNRRNGLRADLAQAIADMKPRFVRFPGGCVAHGNGIENIYHWKHTIGPLETRKPQRNLWGYHQSYGLGYFEYFQFCEDLGAEPIPVVAAGVPCQNSAHNGHPLAGQQCGIPMEEMGDYVQDILDLIEYANGDVHTVWGKKRAEAGHPEPFNLKYIGVGNEDLITDIFEERFTMIYDAIKEKYPEIHVIGTAGPFYEGTDYVEGWKLATKLHVPYMDEHYYNPPGWYIHNQDFYDKYDRSKAKVYLGEYAAHIPGRASTIETALAEALHLCNIERNGDIVAMTSYAPLLAKIGNTQWNPDLIYFDNTEVKPTVGYYVQQLFGQHAGNAYIFSDLQLNNSDDNVRKRIGKSIVRDEVSGDIIMKLVNLLPVEVDVESNISELAVDSENIDATILSGTPADKDAKPIHATVNLDDFKLKPYSLTVIRFKEKT
ncbi:alpha-L-arabinofuranosidase C-terminal domain-containing protein [Sphingobacterium haloxyli]|uniref:non-reducing end alpha-L-arabinofuranosidase n=1 Tax=Sphingobacterium haloxyli TaxID=2100533 RepID=A0A2S9J6A1_9SPHI|nr:alpha-L-arabinofuranosidase C-terminal domain-containing protein [Sphingobacterium haloxyli]PRD48305.1 alpha-L-arabinofuranosidase [Sphingobacterium haloxyli]